MGRLVHQTHAALTKLLVPPSVSEVTGDKDVDEIPIPAVKEGVITSRSDLQLLIAAETKGKYSEV